MIYHDIFKSTIYLDKKDEKTYILYDHGHVIIVTFIGGQNVANRNRRV